MCTFSQLSEDLEKLVTGWRIVADRPCFVRAADVPTIYSGPFTEDDKVSHSDNKSVSVERLAAIARVYAKSTSILWLHSVRHSRVPRISQESESLRCFNCFSNSNSELSAVMKIGTFSIPVAM